jgi:hypothetical protein
MGSSVLDTTVFSRVLYRLSYLAPPRVSLAGRALRFLRRKSNA